jgi:hypothetical protein
MGWSVTTEARAASADARATTQIRDLACGTPLTRSCPLIPGVSRPDEGLAHSANRQTANRAPASSIIADDGIHIPGVTAPPAICRDEARGQLIDHFLGDPPTDVR